MKVRTKTIKGWVNNSSFLFGENSGSKVFDVNLRKYIRKHLKGYKKLDFFDTLKGKNATEKVIIKGWAWRGSWSDPTLEKIIVFYK